MNEGRIIVISGVLEGKEFPISDSLTIGRSPDNAIALTDTQVSRKHAVIQRTPAGIFLKDLGSGNGTFVDDRRVLEVQLNDGAVFTIGGSQLRYEGQAGPPKQEPRT